MRSVTAQRQRPGYDGASVPVPETIYVEVIYIPPRSYRWSGWLIDGRGAAKHEIDEILRDTTLMLRLEEAVRNY